VAEEKSGRVEHAKRGKVGDGQVIVAVGGENGSVMSREHESVSARLIEGAARSILTAEIPRWGTFDSLLL
jgi:hypothetical protein